MEETFTAEGETLAEEEETYAAEEILSAEELVLYQKNKPSFGLGGGGAGFDPRKLVERSGAAWEQAEVERRLELWAVPLQRPRVETRGSLCLGEWSPSKQRAILSRVTGRQFEFMGETVEGNMELTPEEALYLMECSQLELSFGGVSMSLQQGYALLLADRGLQDYIVYAKLMKAGYKVVRHQGDLGLTSYERQVGLDQYQNKNKQKKKKMAFQPVEGTCIFSGRDVTAPIWLQKIREKENPEMYDNFSREDCYARTSSPTTLRIVDEVIDHIIDKSFERLSPKETRKRKISGTSTHKTKVQRTENLLVENIDEAPLSPKYEPSDDLEDIGKLCFRCLKSHPGGESRCYSNTRPCTQCEVNGHYKKIHYIENEKMRNFVLDNLTDPQTGRRFERFQLWQKPPDVIDLEDEEETEQNCDNRDNLQNGDGDSTCHVTSNGDTSLVNDYDKESGNLGRHGGGESLVINHNADVNSCDRADDVCDTVTDVVTKPSSAKDKEVPMDVVDLSSDEDKDDDDELVVIEELPRRTSSVQGASRFSEIDRVHALQSAVSQVNRFELEKLKQQQLLLQKLPTGFNSVYVSRCDVCKITCTSVENLQKHMQGKKHDIKFRSLSKEAQAAFLETSGSKLDSVRSTPPANKPRTEEDKTFYCEICNVGSNSAINHRIHLEGKRHIKSLMALSNRNKYLGDARITQAPPVLKTVRAEDDSPKQVSGKKAVFLPKSVEAIKDLIPNAYQQQLLIVKIMSDFVPDACKPKKEDQTFVQVSVTNEDAEETVDMYANDKALESAHSLLTEKAKEILDKPRDPSDQFKCDVCNLGLKSLQHLAEHVKTSKHKINLRKTDSKNNGTNDSSEDDIEVIFEGQSNQVAKVEERENSSKPSRGFWPKYEKIIPLATAGKPEAIYNFGFHAPANKGYRKRKGTDHPTRGRGRGRGRGGRASQGLNLPRGQNRDEVERWRKDLSLGDQPADNGAQMHVGEWEQTEKSSELDKLLARAASYATNNKTAETFYATKQASPIVDSTNSQLRDHRTDVSNPSSNQSSRNIISSCIPKDSDQTPDHSNSQPVVNTSQSSDKSTNNSSDQPTPTRHSLDQPAPTRHSSDQPPPTRLSSDQPPPTRHSSDQPTPTLHSSDQPPPTHLSSERPLHSSNQPTSTSTHSSSDKPTPTRPLSDLHNNIRQKMASPCVVDLSSDEEILPEKDQTKRSYSDSRSRSSSRSSSRSRSRSYSSSSLESCSGSSELDDVSAHSELRLLKQSSLGSLWRYEGSVGPLISPEMAESMAAVNQRINICPEPRKNFRQSKAKPLEISFDCYKHSTSFKKTSVQLPDYRVVVLDFKAPVPDSAELIQLHTALHDQAQILLAVVNNGTVSFSTFNDVDLPTFIDDEIHEL